MQTEGVFDILMGYLRQTSDPYKTSGRQEGGDYLPGGYSIWRLISSWKEKEEYASTIGGIVFNQMA